MKIFLIGSFGNSEQSKAGFEGAEKELKELGLRPVNEFKLGIPDGWTETERLRKVAEVIRDHCQAVYVLRGWGGSMEARRRLEISVNLRKLIFWEESNDIITIRQYIHDGIIEVENHEKSCV